jgi:hypothetical protein
MSENTELIFLAGFDGHGVLNKDPMVCLNGARPPPKVIVNIFKVNHEFGKVII